VRRQGRDRFGVRFKRWCFRFHLLCRLCLPPHFAFGFFPL
jgi:hypothetical protein